MGRREISFNLGSENTSDFDFGSWTAGVSVSYQPALNLWSRKLTSAIGGESIGHPPNLKFFADYVMKRTDENNTLNDNEFRVGAQFDWITEIDTDKFYFDTKANYTWYNDSPFTNERKDQTRFSFISISANYKVSDNVWLFVGYSDGEMAPLYTADNKIGVGFRYLFEKENTIFKKSAK